MTESPIIRQLGSRDYQRTWQQMRDFTDNRAPQTPDELWCLQHPPVFTLGQAGKRVHLLNPGDIPVVESDRGGQVTYHGPGQLIVYTLIDLRRAGLGVRPLVTLLEDSVISMLDEFDIHGESRQDAPGVYVDDSKVASIGLRIRHGCSYHGISLNVDMDLEPFTRINTCGYKDMEVTQLSNLGITISMASAGKRLAAVITRKLERQRD